MDLKIDKKDTSLMDRWMHLILHHKIHSLCPPQAIFARNDCRIRLEMITSKVPTASNRPACWVVESAHDDRKPCNKCVLLVNKTVHKDALQELLFSIGYIGFQLIDPNETECKCTVELETTKSVAHTVQSASDTKDTPRPTLGFEILAKRQQLVDAENRSRQTEYHSWYSSHGEVLRASIRRVLVDELTLDTKGVTVVLADVGLAKVFRGDVSARLDRFCEKEELQWSYATFLKNGKMLHDSTRVEFSLKQLQAAPCAGSIQQP